MSRQERLERAAEFGRQQAAELEAMLDGMRDEAESMGVDGVAAVQAIFAAAPPATLTLAAEKLFGRPAVEPIQMRRARPRLVYSRD